MPYFDEYSGFDENMKQVEPASEAPAPKPSGRETAAHTIFDYVELLVLTVFFVLLATTFLFRHAVVVGDSMQNTLEDNEHLIISNLFYTPDYGDIVVLEDHEGTGIGEPIIKRIIATEGQTVTIRSEGIYVDGELLREPYAYLEGGKYSSKDYVDYGFNHYLASARTEDGTAYVYEVGENEVFVLGDNRFDSTDSRFFGPVSEDSILGRVLFRLTPFDRFGGIS